MKKNILLALSVFVLMLVGCNDNPAIENGNNTDESCEIKLRDSELVLVVGETKNLIFDIIPENFADTVILNSISWNSLNPDIVSVNNGKIRALKVGESVVSVELLEINAKSTCNVTVIAKNVESVNLNESEITIEREGAFQLIANILPPESTNKAVKWSSSDKNIADVDNNGLVVAKTVGNCIVTVETDDGGFKASCKINVTPILVSDIFIERIYDYSSGQQYPEGVYNLYSFHGDRLEIIIGFIPQNSDNKNLIWGSSNTDLATVEDGLVTITSDINMKGFVYITATSEDGGYISDLEISVDDVHLAAHGLNWNQSGSSNIVSFISSLTGPADKIIEVESVYIINSSNALIQNISNIQDFGNKFIARSQSIDVGYIGLTGQALIEYLSTWKFVYTYKLPEMTDYVTKEVFINASYWSDSI